MLGYVIGGFAAVIWIGLLIFLGIKLIDERMDSKGFKWTIAGSVYLALTFALMGYAIAEEEKACEEKGGQMVKTGESTTYIKSGNAMIPVTSDTHSCTE